MTEYTRVEEHIRRSPFLAGLARNHWEVAWLLALAELGLAGNTELCRRGKVVPLWAGTYPSHQLPGGHRLYPRGENPAGREGKSEFWKELVEDHKPRVLFDISPVMKPADRLVEFFAYETVGTAIGSTSRLRDIEFFDEFSDAGPTKNEVLYKELAEVLGNAPH